MAVSQRIARTIEVPVCAAHAGQGAVELGAGHYLDGHGGFALHFRSYAACMRFREDNPAPMSASAASVTFGRQ